MTARASGFGEDAPPAYVVREDVATLKIDGPLYQTAFSICGFMLADGYDAIEARARAAFEDSSVGAVVMEINSPGGMVAGCLELVDAFAAMSAESGKPLVAYAAESIASAATWIASAAGSIVVPRTGNIGSVGVVSMGINQHGAMEREGVKAILAAHPGGKLASYHAAFSSPDSEEVAMTLAKMHADVRALAELFAADVGARRGMSMDAVLALDAAMFTGAAAVASGLADVVGGRGAAMALARSKIKRKVYSMGSNEGAPAGAAERLLASLCAAVGLDLATATPESVEAASRATKALAELGGKVVALAGVEAHEAGAVVESWKAHALVTLPATRERAKAREVQLAVSTGRMTPGQAYAADGPREFPALPVLSERLASMSLEAVAREVELAAPLPATFAIKAPKRGGAQSVDPDLIKKAGFKDAAEYQAAIDKYGPPPGMEISQ
jgi:ClpP class serine protease